MWELSSAQNLSKQQLKERIHQRRRQILVHSYLYYQLDNPIIEDWKFDYFSNDLVDLQEKYPELSKEAPFHYEFQDFDGSSGFDLKYNQPVIVNVAARLLRYAEQEREKSSAKPVSLSVIEPEEIPL